MKLYHYAPKGSRVVQEGILSVSQIPAEMQKYGKRIGTNNLNDIELWLERTFSGRVRAISVLTEPVQWQGNDPMFQEWVQTKQLVCIDFDELLKTNLVESIWCKDGSDVDGAHEKIYQVSENQIDLSPLMWEKCSQKEGVFFSVIRHYFLVMKEGKIPPQYVKVISK